MPDAVGVAVWGAQMTSAIERIISSQGLLLLEADCVVAMGNLPPNCVDSIVTDPPYGLEFMGKEWDKLEGQAHNVPFSEAETGGLGGFKHHIRYGKDTGAMQDWHYAWATAAFRLLKPGGHALIFGGTRTYHRLACAVEDAGFEIRDTVQWLYGQGFPKGLRPVPQMWDTVLKCLSNADAPYAVQVSRSFLARLPGEKEPTAHALARIQREGVPALIMETGKVGDSSGLMVTLLSETQLEVAGMDLNTMSLWKESLGVRYDGVSTSTTGIESRTTIDPKISSLLTGLSTVESTPARSRSVTLPNGWMWPACDVSDPSNGASERWKGIPVLTALGPASLNPIVKWRGWNVALKPSHEPVLLARKPLGEKTVAANVQKWGTGGLNIDGGRIGTDAPISSHLMTGRGHAMAGNTQENWPDPYQAGDAGEHNTQSLGRWPANLILQHSDDCTDVPDGQCVPGCPVAELDAQSPGAPRFFYQAKSSSSERNKGCDDLYWARTSSGHTPITQAEYEALDPKQRAQGNVHPTVKPTSLMRYLVRLVTPPGGIVLDPFLGSGTTALAANLEGLGCLAMESDPTSVLIAHARWSGLHQ